MAVGFKALDQWYSAIKILVRSCRKSGSAVMDTAQCVFPHTFKAQLSTPAKLIKWISVISLRPCRPRQDCEECWSLPKDEELSWISCGRLPLTTDCWTSPQSLANRQDYLLGWVGVEQVGPFHNDNKETCQQVSPVEIQKTWIFPLRPIWAYFALWGKPKR